MRPRNQKFILIIGGVRSGKSRYAGNLAKRLGKKVAFIATCVPHDEEMKKRVTLHKKKRPRSWKVIEEPKNIKSTLNKLKSKFDIVIIDCLGLLMSNFLHDGVCGKKEIESIAKTLVGSNFTSIVVSNDVGSSLVATNALARKFQDVLGLANQTMAKQADEVIVMQSGIPVRVK